MSYNSVPQYEQNTAGYFSLAGSQLGLKEGKVNNPDIFYEMSGTIYIGLFRGEVDFIKAQNQKIIKVDAPLSNLIKMGRIV